MSSESFSLRFASFAQTADFYTNAKILQLLEAHALIAIWFGFQKREVTLLCLSFNACTALQLPNAYSKEDPGTEVDAY
jgi:hypothetical protein